MTFWKKKKYGVSKKSVVARDQGDRERRTDRAQRVFRTVKLFHMIL